MAEARAEPALRGLRFALIAGCFALSGAAALIDQVVWLRLLALVFGNTTHATATLLAVFLGGLGAGSLLAGRFADRVRRPLLVYAAIETAIAGLALASPTALELVSDAYVAIYRALGAQPAAFAIARTVLAALALLPPTVLMGCTLPLVLTAVARSVTGVRREGERPRDRVGYATAVLYATNTLGAVAGVALAGLVTIRLLGLTATLELAAALNLLAALGCFALDRSALRRSVATGSREADRSSVGAADAVPPEVRSHPVDGSPELAEPAGASGSSQRRGLLALFFLMGATSLAYEVLWTRILVFYLGSSVYAFSLMLLVFLLGLGLGSVAAGRLAGRTRQPLVLLAVLELCLALWAGAQVPLFGRLNDLLVGAAAWVGLTGWSSVVLAQFLAVMVPLLPPTLLMGMSFPLAVRAVGTVADHIGRDAAAVYGANTVGSVLGSLGTGFLLIPLAGTQSGLLVVGMLNSGLAGWVAWYALRPAANLAAGGEGARRTRATLRLLAPASALLLLVLLLTLPPDRVILAAGIFRDDAAGDLIFFSEDASAAVTVRNRRAVDGPYRSLELNGVNVAGTSPDLWAVQKMQGHLPLLLADRRGDVVHIGFGSGGTAHAVTRHPVASVLVVEISPAVLSSSDRFFRDVNHGVLEDPRVATEINDGRNFLLASPRRFDAVLSDSIHPRYAGNGSLYTLEYFALARARLREGGVASMWLPTYSLSTRNFAMIVKAFAEVFPNTTIWYEPSALNAFTIVTGRLAPTPWNPATLDAAFADPVVAGELAGLGISGPADLLLCYMVGGEALQQALADVPPHVDDQPAVEYESGMVLMSEETWLSTFQALLRMRPADPPADYLAGLSPVERERARAGWSARAELLDRHRDQLAAGLAAVPETVGQPPK